NPETVFGAHHDRDREATGEIVRDQSHGARGAALQLLRSTVRAEGQLPRRPQHFVPGRSGDVLPAIECLGSRRDGDTRRLGDVAQPRPSLVHAPTVHAAPPPCPAARTLDLRCAPLYISENAFASFVGPATPGSNEEVRHERQPPPEAAGIPR